MKTIKKLLCSLLVALIIFAEIPMQASAAANYIWPLSESNLYITSYFGSRVNPLTGKTNNHSGIDITAAKNAKVYASSAGTLYLGYSKCTHNYGKSSGCGCGDTSYGNYVYIKDDNGIHTYYGHLSSIAFDELIKAGVTKKSTSTKGRKIGKVKQGQVIGYVGSTGASSGNQLHFEMRKVSLLSSKKVDPLDYLQMPASKIQISMDSYPVEIVKGEDFTIKGNISSNYQVVSATGSIVNSSNSTVQTSTLKLNTKSHSLESSNINKNLKFNNLEAGTYTLKIVAKDASGKSVSWSKEFTVLAARYIWPLSQSSTNITSYYGSRIHPLTGKANNHSGIDIGASKNAKVYASSSGTLYLGYSKCTHNYGKSKNCGCGGTGYGNYIYIKDASGMYTYYAHLTSIAFDELIKAGVTKRATSTKGRKIGTVKQGQIIGYVGSTGSSTGNHLHFEMRKGSTSPSKKVDPIDYVQMPVSKIGISMTAYPVELRAGSSFNLKGSVTSNYKVASVVGSIVNSSGSTIQTVTVKPKSKSHSIESSAINTKLKFGSLSAGTYTLKLVARDASNKSVTWSQNFTVKAKATASTLKVSMSAYPSSITKGKSFNLKGSVASNHNITSVVGSIVNSSGNAVQTVTVKPNSKSHSIESSNINKNLKFGSLSAGTYTLKIVAKDSSGKSVTWSKNFTVKNAASTLSVEMSAYPSSVVKGNSFNLKGTVKSNYKISSIVGSIVNSSGSAVQSVTVKPNATSHSIESSAINKNLKFGSLAAGKYTLKIVAKDANGKTVTWSKEFTVKLSSLKIAMSSAPSSVTKGKSFNLTGKITSNKKITGVTGSIVNSSGKAVQTVTVTPNATSHSIESSKINKNLKFGSLAKGSYTLKIVAKDASGNSVTYSKAFKIV